MITSMGSGLVGHQIKHVPDVSKLCRLEQGLLGVEGVYVFVVVGMADHMGFSHIGIIQDSCMDEQ